MKEIKDYKTETFYASYYKELLENMNNIVIMDDPKFDRDNIIIDFLYANALRERPAILVTNKKKIIDKVKYVLKRKYDFVAPEYRDIKDMKMDTDSNRKKAFIFAPDTNDFALTMELAMILNKKLLSIGFKPLIIIDCFDELYNDKMDETVEEYLEEVLLKGTHPAQSTVIMSELSIIGHNIMGRIDGNKALMRQANGIVISKGYLHDSVGVRPGVVADLEAAINNIKNEDLRVRAASVFQKMMLKLAINNEEEKLKEGFVLNINKGEIGEFRV